MASVSYTTGTVSVNNAATAVTGSGTNWLTSGAQAGDDFRVAGLSVRISSVNSDTSITLAYAWPGTTVSGGNYEVHFKTTSDRAMAAALSVLNSLTSGIVTAFAALSHAADKLAYSTGAGTMALVDFKSWARSFIGAADAATAKTSAGIAGLTDTQTLTNKTLVDSTTSIVDDVDATKKGQFQLSGVTTATTRTLTWPNANGTIMTRENAETLSGAKTISINTATTAATYLNLRPTDYGTGNAQLALSKSSIAARWTIQADDGAGTGIIYIASSAILATAAYSTTTASAANVNVASDGTLARSTSSEKYKTDIEPMADSFADAIFDMVPIWYRSTCAMDNPDHSWWGLSAEAVAATDPRLVHWKTHEIVEEMVKVTREQIETYLDRVETVPKAVIGTDPETGEARAEIQMVEQPVYLDRVVLVEDWVPEQRAIPLAVPEPEGVAYERLTALLINVAQRQRAQIDAMEARLSALEAA